MSPRGAAVALSADGNTAIVGGPTTIKHRRSVGLRPHATELGHNKAPSWLVPAFRNQKAASRHFGRAVGRRQHGARRRVTNDNRALARPGSSPAARASGHSRAKAGRHRRGRQCHARRGSRTVGRRQHCADRGPGDNHKHGATWVFVAAPTVAGVNPMTGSARGGTNVTVTGTNFTGATAGEIRHDRCRVVHGQERNHHRGAHAGSSQGQRVDHGDHVGRQRAQVGRFTFN